jgi:hypothetical protein
MRAGDRVKLRSDLARTMTAKSRGGRYGGRGLDWTKRRGVVTYAGAKMITVRWDGRKSTDQWPSRALTIVYNDT